MHWFDDLRRAQLAALEPGNPRMAAWLRELGGLYLYGTIGSEAVLLPDGRVRVWWADDWPESEEATEREATPEERTAALVLGAERWPQVAELLPARPPDAPNCAVCGGAGMIPRPGGVVCAQCHGLGWIPRAI